MGREQARRGAGRVTWVGDRRHGAQRPGSLQRTAGLDVPRADPAPGPCVRPLGPGHHLGRPGLPVLPVCDGRRDSALARSSGRQTRSQSCTGLAQALWSAVRLCARRRARKALADVGQPWLARVSHEHRVVWRDRAGVRSLAQGMAELGRVYDLGHGAWGDSMAGQVVRPEPPRHHPDDSRSGRPDLWAALVAHAQAADLADGSGCCRDAHVPGLRAAWLGASRFGRGPRRLGRTP